jgi:hypothetical protein
MAREVNERVTHVIPLRAPSAAIAVERFLPLDAAALGHIHKTAEDPPWVSVHDVILCVTGQNARNAKKY